MPRVDPVVTTRWHPDHVQVSVLLCAIGLLVAVAIVSLSEPPRPAHSTVAATSAPPSPSASPTLAPLVRVTSPGFFSWALLDRRTREVVGSPNLAEPSDTMSMVKVWLAADYLTHTDPDPDAKTRALLRRMIVDSDNAAATKVFGLNGGIVTIERMVSVCGLVDSAPNYRENRWSPTIVSARDTVRLGECIAEGTAAGPRWTEWLLAQMREVRGEGDFGVRLALPKADRAAVAIKNGWFMRPEDDLWHVACLAIGPTWVVSVLLRYPERLGLGHGKKVCQEVGSDLLAAQALG
ncbi:serine hydrolase [Hamadaea sp. NPDC050747]|uniref:serine hydrolase n=1 Tax=Hamadaea sp. NPDC050747 TaxID=3155789 RepID=UPI0033E75F2F